MSTSGPKPSSSSSSSSSSSWPIPLYLPNIVGYVRILSAAWAFAIAFDNKPLFTLLYFFSFFCDYVDGRFAVWFNQKSTFGAVLDMVVDRLSTSCLLMLLGHLYSRYLTLCMALLCLDIGSHWYQMYISLISHKASHKDVSSADFWLMRWYYGSRPFMAYCCIGAELLYLLAYLLHKDLEYSRFLEVNIPSFGKVGVLWLLGLVLLPGWFLKQITNVIQLLIAAEIMVKYDVAKRIPDKKD